jgi:hypothetical protein
MRRARNSTTGARERVSRLRMPFNLRSRWLNLLHTLWFVPSAVSAAYIALAAVLVRIDDAEHFQSGWSSAGTTRPLVPSSR